MIGAWGNTVLPWILEFLAFLSVMPDFELKKFVDDLTRCWREHRYADLHAFFHRDVVLLAPGSAETIVGVDAMVESYRHFGAAAELYRFEVNDVAFYQQGSIVVCHLKFEVDYEIDGVRCQDTGMDVYVIDVSDTPPQIVWRTQVDVPSGSD